MEDRIIKLKIRDILLGTLCMECSNYVFYANVEGFKMARMMMPIIPFVLNENGKKEYVKLPYPFSKFLEQCEREDIAKYLNITATDTDFDKLYKYASANIEPETFYITI